MLPLAESEGQTLNSLACIIMLINRMGYQGDELVTDPSIAQSPPLMISSIYGGMNFAYNSNHSVRAHPMILELDISIWLSFGVDHVAVLLAPHRKDLKLCSLFILE